MVGTWEIALPKCQTSLTLETADRLGRSGKPDAAQCSGYMNGYNGSTYKSNTTNSDGKDLCSHPHSSVTVHTLAPAGATHSWRPPSSQILPTLFHPPINPGTILCLFSQLQNPLIGVLPPYRWADCTHLFD